MLPLETCRVLKEAGFPQPIEVDPIWRKWDCKGYGGVYEDGYFHPPSGPCSGEVHHSNLTTLPAELLYCPTIEDLLQELGTNFASLEFSPSGKWIARGGRTFPGPAPEDVLAALYLAVRDY